MSQRDFKQGVGTGRDVTNRRARQGLRKQKERNQARLNMRRSRMVTQTPQVAEPRIDDAQETQLQRFERTKEAAMQALGSWYEQKVPASEALARLQQLLCFENRDIALSAYPVLFGSAQGQDLLQRLAAFIAQGPQGEEESCFSLALSCVIEIMYEPENIACVKVLCDADVHGAALRLLSAEAGLPSAVRQELFSLLGNTGHNNQHARLLLLNTPSLPQTLAQNLQDGLERQDWSLISATLYVMYVLCENSHGGITPPFSYFDPLSECLLGVLQQLCEVSEGERTREQYDAALAVVAFFESIALNTTLNGNQDSTELLVAQRRGVLTMASTPMLLTFFQSILRGKNRQLKKKVASTISFMCSAGVDAIRPLMDSSTGFLPLLVNMMTQMGTEPYALRHVLRIIYLLSKYGTVYLGLLLQSEAIQNVCALLIGGRGRVLDHSQAVYAMYALHKVCTVEGEPLQLQAMYAKLCNENLLASAISRGLQRCVQSGDMETAENMVDSLARLLSYCPQLVKPQMEDHDAINMLARIQHMAHVESALYKKASALENTYFNNY